MRLTLLLQIFLLMLVPAAAFAQDIVVRAGLHDDYSRLVFDWPNATDYSLSRPAAGTLEVKFAKNSGVDAAQLAGQTVRNIKALDIVSEAPLTVRLSVPEKSSVRDFTAGSRVIIDVYNPAGAVGEANTIKVNQGNASTQAKPGEPPAEEEKPPPPVTEPQESAVQQSAPPPTASEPQPDEAQLKAVPAGGNAAPAPSTPAPTGQEQAEPKVAVEKPKDAPVKLKAREQPTIVTLSSTTPFGFASFVKDGTLWLVSGRDDALITPQASGSNAEAFQPFSVAPSPNAKVFKGPLPGDVKLKGQGGNVLWRILASPDLKEGEALLPLRRNVREGDARGGYLLWPLKSAREVVDVSDPNTGELIKVVLVAEDEDFSGAAHEFVDFTVLQSPIGMAVISKTDGVEIKIVRGGVEISRPGGLSMIDENRVAFARQKDGHAKAAEEAHSDSGAQKIYNFSGWLMGGPNALADNRTLILGRLSEMSPSERASNLLLLAKAYLANNMGAETLGLLRFVEQEIPEIANTPEYRSLRGAARALAGQNEAAFDDLSMAQLKTYPEINTWRGHVLAGLGDWQQAAASVPNDALGIIMPYPPLIRSDIALSLAEIYLRSGQPKKAGEFMDLVEKDIRLLRPNMRAALTYLKGEKARQQGDDEVTEKAWLALARGNDELYRAKASLALTRFLVDKGKMPPRQAIDKLEGLRYAWRGDDLEANINYWLGRTYFENGDFIKGLNIMRDATTYASHTGLAQRIANDMSGVFVDLFTSEKLNDVSPMDAAALYDQFRELSPPDERGDKIVEKLAEHLAKAGLVGRAGNLMQHQVDHRLKGYEAFRIATRLAALRLLDDKADEAMQAVKKAENVLNGLSEELQNDKNKRIVAFLKARALSGQGHADQALALLRDMELTPGLNKLKADIAWNASYWDDAAEALQDVILDQNISLTRPLEEMNSQLLIKRAVALNLAGNRVALANMREKYSEAMAQTPQAKIFEIITRPRQSITLADRETLMSIVSEVDLFDGVLNAIRNGEENAEAAEDENPGGGGN